MREPNVVARFVGGIGGLFPSDTVAKTALQDGFCAYGLALQNAQPTTRTAVGC